MAQGQVRGSVTLHPHWGHQKLQETLARAWARDSLPTTLLIQGMKGVGKQHLALWLGRLILCQEPGPAGPCEACHSCRLALTLEHPDLHWFFPLPRPKSASTPEKLARALEDARWETLEEIRANPLKPTSIEGARSLYLAAARTLRRQAHNRPSMGRHQVFILAEAETLAQGESSSEAANALLKLLEEPPDGTVLILTSGEPGRLLPTIRSRTTPLQLPPLRDEEVAEFLIQVKKLDRETAKQVAGLAHGSIGRGLRLLPDEGEEGPLAQTRTRTFELIRAVLAPSPVGVFQVPLTFKSTGARGLMDLLESLEEWLRDLALAAAGSEASWMDPATKGFFTDVLKQWRIHPARVAGAVRLVDEARKLAGGNVNPQLVLFDLLMELRRALLPEAEPAAAER